MNEIGANYTPHIQYITDTNTITIKCDNVIALKNRAFDYKRLFQFINYDFAPLSDELRMLYRNPSMPFSKFKNHMEKISGHLNDIFVISNDAFTRAFLYQDYIEYLRHNVLNATTDTERHTLRVEFIQFMTLLHKFHPNYDFSDDLLTENFFSDVFETEILPYTHLHGPTLNLVTDSTPPCSLIFLHGKIKRYLSPIISFNSPKIEEFRLLRDDLQTRIEFRKLVENALPKSADMLTTSERIALKIHSANVEKHSSGIQKPSDILVLKNHNPFYEFTYWEDINLNFTTASSSPKEMSFSFKHIEGILALDMHYFIKNQLYVFKCTECGNLYTTKRLSFYCCNTCKNNYRNRIKEECKPWNTYETIRKKIYARFNNYFYTLEEHDDIMKKLNNILNSYFACEIEAESASDKLTNESHIIDKDFRYELIYGDLKQKQKERKALAETVKNFV